MDAILILLFREMLITVVFVWNKSLILISVSKASDSENQYKKKKHCQTILRYSAKIYRDSASQTEAIKNRKRKKKKRIKYREGAWILRGVSHHANSEN